MLEEPPPYPLFDIFRDKGFFVGPCRKLGYGRTDGPLDFCGPASQRAVATAVNALRRNSSVRSNAVFVHGRSRGATTVSMAATEGLGIAGVILEDGTYDQRSAYEQIRHLDAQPFRNIAANIEPEPGTSTESFLARSLLLTDQTIPVPVLLLHGTDDIRASVE